jgi:hypothetical protein
MALQLGALHKALLDAGAGADAARAAAEEVAAYERQMADLRSDLTLLKWMVGVNTGLVLLVLGKVW